MSMRLFRIAISLAVLFAVAPTASAQNESVPPASGFELAEPVPPVEPVGRVIALAPDTTSDGSRAAPTLSAEGLPLPEVHLPGPTAAGRSAAVVYGRAAPLVWLDPGEIGAIGSRRPPAAPPIHAPGNTGPVAILPPADWTPQWPEVARNAGGVVAERQVIAYYGHPYSAYMGILGESPIEEMAADLLLRASEYDAINGPIGVAPAFHIIYGTVYEDATIGILRETKLLEYIEFAGEHDIIVFLDHQIGRYTVDDAIASMLPYLAYDHVHLAIDPEWATAAPGQVIGGIQAEELNRAQETISNYLIANNIDGPKMLVVHQFNWRMIGDRELVRADYPGVQLIHNADGFGRPAEKYVSWEFNVQASNMPLKGFKLFYPKSWRDGGYDEPLLSPIEVMQLEPIPVYIQYQ